MNKSKIVLNKRVFFLYTFSFIVFGMSLMSSDGCQGGSSNDLSCNEYVNNFLEELNSVSCNQDNVTWNAGNNEEIGCSAYKLAKKYSYCPGVLYPDGHDFSVADVDLYSIGKLVYSSGLVLLKFHYTEPGFNDSYGDKVEVYKYFKTNGLEISNEELEVMLSVMTENNITETSNQIVWKVGDSLGDYDQVQDFSDYYPSTSLDYCYID